MAALLPFHTTHPDYTDAQTHVYHDQSDCPEALKIRILHRTEGSGGRTYCKECARIVAELRRAARAGRAVAPPSEQALESASGWWSAQR